MGNISKDDKMTFKTEDKLVGKRKKIDASMTKPFYLGRYIVTALKKRGRVKKGTLPSMIYFTWIKCYKTCNVSSGITQGEINKGLPTGKGVVPQNSLILQIPIKILIFTF